mgnify:CR=1 FL=1
MSTTLDQLAERVRVLEAAEVARSVMYDYAAAVDSRNWQALRHCFTDDATMVLGPNNTVGADAIVAALRDMLPEGFLTQHLLVNPRIASNDADTVVIDFTIYYLHEGSGYEAVGWGSYRDTVVIENGRGRIARKEFTPAQHLPGSIATVGGRVRRFEVAEAAREATWRYATAVDGPDLDLLRDVFTEDAVLVSRSGAKEGREAVLDYYSRALEAPIGRKHLLTNQQVDVTGPNEAVVSSYFAYTYAGDDTSVLGWGSYVDRVRVDNGVGRIVEKRITIDASGDVLPGWATTR